MPLSELVWYALSLALLVYAFVHIVRRTRLSHRGFPRVYDVLLFTALVFLAAVAFEIGQAETSSLFAPLYHAIQIVGGDRDLDAVRLPDAQPLRDILRVYSSVLFVLTSIAAILAIVSYLMELLTVPLVRLLSLRRDVFVFSQLDERSLKIAHSVSNYYEEHSVDPSHAGMRQRRRACLVFACVDREEERELASTAYEMGAVCSGLDVTDVVRSSARARLVTVLLSSKDEGRNIAEAKTLREQLAGDGRKGSSYRIIALTSLANSETVLMPETVAVQPTATDASAFANVVVRSFDPSRALVERVVDRYPLFLATKPDADWQLLAVERCGEQAVRAHALAELYEPATRHVLVVGAGTVGREFVLSTLWASRIDGVHMRVDVIDCEADPADAQRTRAEACLGLEAPGIMAHVDANEVPASVDARGDAYTDETYDLHFHRMDVETDTYARFLRSHAHTISYVFVALGNDRANVSCAMRTRQLLERELVRRSSDREHYLMASRPLIIAVVENDELTSIVQAATAEGQPYDIVCIGRLDESLTYESLLSIIGESRREYDRRSVRANMTHRKYRLFAYLRNLKLGRHGMTPVGEEEFAQLAGAIDWTSDPSTWESGYGREAVDAYNAFRRTSADTGEASLQTHALEEQALRAADGRPSREWLLRMEHERWNAYIRAEGFETAGRNEVEALFNTGQRAGGSKLHRSNLAGLHPCLVSYDELSELDAPVGELYRSLGRADALPSPFQLQDDEFIGV